MVLLSKVFLNKESVSKLAMYQLKSCLQIFSGKEMKVVKKGSKVFCTLLVAVAAYRRTCYEISQHCDKTMFY